MKNGLKKDAIVLLISLASLICAAVALNSSLNQLIKKQD